MRFKDKVVWITGASTGIGEALTRALIKEEARLVLSSRTEEELDQVKEYCHRNKADFMLLAFDLEKTGNYQDLVDQAIARFGQIDILISNAGISQRAYAHETDPSVVRKILEINFFSAVELTSRVLPVMLKAGGGSIAVTSSISGIFGFPMRSAYAASKHALSGYFETMGIELRNRNVFVTIAYPGRVQTGISLNALQKDGTVWGRMDEGQQQGISVDKCARIYLRAIYKRKRTVYIGGKELLMVYFKRYLPRLFYLLVGRLDPNR
jgi:short-subunit dehydrogenase